MRARRGVYAWWRCTLPACRQPFSRPVYDLLRSSSSFCSRACRDAAARGRTVVDVVCSGCARSFQKLASAAARTLTHYCTEACARAHFDHAAAGALGGRAGGYLKLGREALFNRSQRGGLARAANLSPGRLREIAALGVAARRADPSVMRRAVVSRRAGRDVVLGVRLGRGRGS